MALSRDYICGLIDGEGSFNLSTNQDGSKIPTFELRMNVRDKELIEGIRDYLGLRNKVYTYHYPDKTGHIRRGPSSMLIVRDVGSLKNIIVPTFYNNLVGYKRQQFNEWLENIGTDSLVPKRYKVIYRLYKVGFYDRVS